MKPAVGLCDGCTFRRLVKNRRGSIFLLCQRSEEDPRYPKYPPLPVLTCRGFKVVADAHAGEAEA